MSELVVFVFRDQYRAPEVLNELRRREWEWIADLDDAVAVTLDEHGHTKVHLSVELPTSEAARWTKMWGSLLAVTLFLPLTKVVVEAADHMIGVGSTLTETTRTTNPPLPDARWWQESLPEDFLRDVGAIIGLGSSAIFMILRTENLLAVLRQLRSYGEILLHTTLGPRQDEEMRAMLAQR